ncbi:hypothetical protein IT409_02755, partial [Candidatus Falkowbacteria bacterium]|nr:hypothetical protein [Candidatus Falkowbacteria bacterium]
MRHKKALIVSISTPTLLNSGVIDATFLSTLFKEFEWYIQLSSATLLLKTSKGVFQPSLLRGLVLSAYSTAEISSFVTS